MNQNICAVVVTYNPDLPQFMNFIDKVINQIDRLIIIDNNSNLAAKEYLNKINKDNICCIFNNDNLGLSYAQNQGLKLAIQQKYEYVVLFDQDSLPQNNMIKKLKDSYEYLETNNKVAAVGPKFIDQKTQIPFPFIKNGLIKNQYLNHSAMKNVEVDLLISSGCMMKTKALKEIGLMDEGLFIDSIDIDWSFRAKFKGYKIYGVNDALMEHSIGDNMKTIWLGRRRNVLIHSPLRKYYMTRNRILLLKKESTPINWKINNSFRLLVSSIMYPIVVSENRIQNTIHIFKGLKDGIKGKNGSIND